MCKVANYASSIKRYCKPERRNGLSGKKPFGECVPCNLRRNSISISIKSRRLHNRLTTIFMLLHLPSLLNVRTLGRITNLHSSTPHPQRRRSQTRNHTGSKPRPRRFPSHLALHLRAVLHRMSWISMTHLRWRSTRVSCFSRMIT